MVNILVAPDKFKGSLTADEVCNAVSEGLKQSGIVHQLAMVPLADGGEGTADLLTHYFDGTFIRLVVHDPLGAPVTASYGISGDRKTAFIEMAKASGLQLLPKEKRNPLLTNTTGTGELIRDAVLRGVRHIVLGIGGSATNDAGTGMAAALGFEFFDSLGKTLEPNGKNLTELHVIRAVNVLPALRDVKITALCDVTNPLHGMQGAAHVYAPQKGASAEVVDILDRGLLNFERVASDFFKMPANFPGAGAAGGLGAGAKLFLNATLHPGMDYLANITALEEKIKAADLVITGEGKLDHQSLSGKVVMTVTTLAKKMNTPAIVVCGKNDLAPEVTAQQGIGLVLSLVADDIDETDAMRHAYTVLKKRILEYFSRHYIL